MQVDGTQTTINSTSLTVDDLNITLASGAADSAAANGAGITIDGASASLTYAHSGTKFVFNKPLDVTGNIGVTGTVDGVDIQTLNTTAGAALPKAGGTMTGGLNMGSQNISAINNATAVSFLSTNGYWVGGTQRMNGSGNLLNIGTISSGAITTSGAFTGQNINLRNDTAGDGTTIRDISFLTTAAQGSDDRIALIRASNQAGDGTNRGGKLTFYTRQSGSANFNSALILDKDAGATFAGLLTVNNNIKFGASTNRALLTSNAVYSYIGQTNAGTENPESNSAYFFGINPRMGTDRTLVVEARTADGAGAIVFKAGSGSYSTGAPERMRIDSLGNVLFGNGNSHSPKIQGTTNSGRTPGSPGYSFNDDLNTGMFQPISTPDTVAFSTSGAERMRITNDGTVGIGATSGEANLVVRDLTDGTHKGGRIGFGIHEAGALQIYDAVTMSKTAGSVVTDSTASGGENVTLSSGQLYGPYHTLPRGQYRLCVKMKTTNAAYTGSAARLTLHTSSATVIPESRTVRGVDFGTNNKWQTFSVPFQVVGAATNAVEFYLFALNSQAISVDYFFIMNDTDSHSTRVYGNQTVDGNVGIGTTAPASKLHVYNSGGGNATDKATMLSESVMKLQPHVSNSTNLLVAQVNGGNGIGLQVTNGPATANWDLALSPFGGKVGIGTATPATALDVVGDITQNSVTVKQEYFTLPASSTSGRRIRITLGNYESCYVRIGAQRSNGGDAICYWEGLINNNNNANYATVFQSKSGNPAITFDYTTTTIFQWTFNASLSSGWGTFYVQEIGGTATIQQLMT